MITQQLNLEWLVPIALERLSINPFDGGELNPGDLLASILMIKEEFFMNNPELLYELNLIFVSNSRRPVLHTIFTLRAIRSSVHPRHFEETDSDGHTCEANCASAAGPSGSLSHSAS